MTRREDNSNLVLLSSVAALEFYKGSYVAEIHRTVSGSNLQQRSRPLLERFFHHMLELASHALVGGSMEMVRATHVSPQSNLYPATHTVSHTRAYLGSHDVYGRVLTAADAMLGRYLACRRCA
jgi:hypothetical protein